MDEQDKLIQREQVITNNVKKEGKQNQLNLKSIEGAIYIAIIVWCHYIIFTSYYEASKPYSNGEKWLPGLAKGFIPGMKRVSSTCKSLFVSVTS